jgi:hypothetical protein
VTAPSRSEPYHERCADPRHPCSLSYDFEPSGLAGDVFGGPSTDTSLAVWVVNEDGALFRWNLAPTDAWEHDHVDLIRLLGPAIDKVEALASASCPTGPRLLAAANFAPGRRGRSEAREHVVSVDGDPQGPVRVLRRTSEFVRSLGAQIEALALTPDCAALVVGARMFLSPGGERLTATAWRLPLAADGDLDDPTSVERLDLSAPTCSGEPEGLSSLDLGPDGTWWWTTSAETVLHVAQGPRDAWQGRLSGSLFRQRPGAVIERVRCFEGHKPEGVVALSDGSVRVVFEDDTYGGRPVRASAVRVDP